MTLRWTVMASKPALFCSHNTQQQVQVYAPQRLQQTVPPTIFRTPILPQTLALSTN